jgi:hypothetical protein
MASQPPNPNGPIETPVDDPIPSPTDPPPGTPSDPVDPDDMTPDVFEP